jgi:hypothetical protein
MLFIDTGIFADEKGEKREAERRIADANFFELLGIDG